MELVYIQYTGNICFVVDFSESPIQFFFWQLIQTNEQSFCTWQDIWENRERLLWQHISAQNYQ